MATESFVYQDPYPLGKDQTNYRKVEGSEKYVSVAFFEGDEILKVDPKAGPAAVLAEENIKKVECIDFAGWEWKRVLVVPKWRTSPRSSWWTNKGNDFFKQLGL